MSLRFLTSTNPVSHNSHINILESTSSLSRLQQKSLKVQKKVAREKWSKIIEYTIVLAARDLHTRLKKIATSA